MLRRTPEELSLPRALFCFAAEGLQFVLPLKRPDQTSYRARCRTSRSNLRTISVPQDGSQKPYRNDRKAIVRRPFS